MMGCTQVFYILVLLSTDMYLFRHIISRRLPDIREAFNVCPVTSFSKSLLLVIVTTKYLKFMTFSMLFSYTVFFKIIFIHC